MVAPIRPPGSAHGRESGHPSEPISPPPLTRPAPDRLLAHLGNGHVGLRVGRVPLLDGLAIVNGFWGAQPDDGIPTFAPVPYPLAGDIRINGLAMSESPEAVRFISQRSDFAAGELTSRFIFSAGDSRATVSVVTFCSRTDPALVLQEIELHCDRDADVVLTASISAVDVPGRWLAAGEIPRSDPATGDAWLLWEGLGETTRCGLVIATLSDESGGAALGPVTTEPDDCRFSVSHTFRAHAGRPLRLRTIVGLVPELAHARPERQAALLVSRGLVRGWDGLRDANRRAWSELCAAGR